eukprot:scpid79563/ scgid0750/ 
MYDNAAWSCWPAGIFNVRKVINSVLALVGKRAHCLPSHGTLSQLYVELKGPVSLQLAEELEGEENTTLHSDGTSKHGRKYGSFQIATSQRVYSLGMVDMERGTAVHTLEMLKAVLADVAKVSSDSEGIGERIVSNIKNTMSDRSIVQKNFNELLQAYRAEVLPDVHASWSSLSEAQQKQLSVTIFFLSWFALHCWSRRPGRCPVEEVGGSPL